ncbi:uncharacterized protein B0H18DRAFT_854402, partial [Fomitopsis serialis]|uniref:uncharacterized protein n=1 Tax=Fomitopsis serialis TaxID=139415 RepID=UPI0020077186
RKRETDVGKSCHTCQEPHASFRCTECFNGPLLCRKCVVEAHTWTPLHRVERWTGTFFERAQLSDLGLVFSIGHHGRPCPSSSHNRTRKLTVVHTTGVQSMVVQYCECIHDGKFPDDRPVQLWSAGLWPA